MSSSTTIPNDPDPALRAELIAALAVLAPQIRGLTDLATTSISTELLAEVNSQITARTNRQSLINTVLAGLDAVVVDIEALNADGYPDLPATPVLGSLFAELQEENSDLTAGIAVFADAATITAGPLTQTPNPDPPTKAGP